MRIVLLTENTYCGGLDSFIVSLVEAWPDPTDELMLICNHDHPGLEVIRRRVRRPIAILGHAQPLAGRCLRRLHRLPGGNYLAKAASPLIRAGCFLAQLIGMGRLLAKVNPDRLMIINGGYPAGDSCRAATIAWDRLRGARPKAIHNIHNLAYPPRWWDRAAEQAIDRRVGRAAAAFVAVSRACAEALPANRPAAVAAGTPVTHIYNGIADPPAAALGTDVRAALGIPAAAPLAVMLGTYEPRKGHEMLIAAFARVAARVPTAHLVICGHGYPADRERVGLADSHLGLPRRRVGAADRRRCAGGRVAGLRILRPDPGRSNGPAGAGGGHAGRRSSRSGGGRRRA